MNKRMKALLEQIDAKMAEAKKSLELETPDEAAATAALDECDKLQKSFELAKRLYEADKSTVPPEGEIPPAVEAQKANGFGILAKLLRRETLNEAEKALVTGTGGTHGENLLIPEDVSNTIRELRKSYVSARGLVNVMPTNVLTGSFVFESGTPEGLTDFNDGGDIPAGADPTFAKTAYTIKLKGKNIPISNVLTSMEAAQLTAYLNKWFVRCAIISENKDIFACLAKDKVAKNFTTLKELRKSMNADLDPSCLIGGVIATNQTGFDLMDSESDTTGHSFLSPDPTNAARKLYNSLPILVFPDAQLPNVTGAAPVFYGNTQAGCDFYEL
ncbi:MAG: phage major capsid protein, partial [Oscillospiraceae bacterium]